MQHTYSDLQFTHILPYGAILHDHGDQHGVRFVVFSRSATEMRLLLYDEIDDLEPAQVIEFDARSDRWGDIWSVFIKGLKPGQLYHFQANGPWNPENGHRFDPQARLIDPYAKALAGTYQVGPDNLVRPPKCVVVDDYFDWDGDRHLKRELSESVIYEMHIRGFTKHPSSNVENPGTYLGVIEKIPYLKSLGVTAVELMPVHEFPMLHYDGTAGVHQNYWGYDPMAFFAPHRGYATDCTPGAQVNEFKRMVKALHAAGIEVILDVVFNHTCEGNERGPTLSFKGLENNIYYMLENDRQLYKNFSGCGNTVNGNHPIVRELIFHCLRHWVHNYHIDGFRFDLASILSRDRNGELVSNPPLVELIGEDPMLRDTKIIAEAWDAAGAYQVGSFGGLRWAEWNGRFRDDVRGYWNGEMGSRNAFSTRLSGSSDLYGSDGRAPYCSINFVTSHDGFTLNDLVSYNDKHNLANGEDNRDGDNHNFSNNFGVEGPTSNQEIESLRLRQIKNFWVTTLLSQGVPMIVAGDEFRRTQQGNNNAYCQDNEISWLDWNLCEENEGLLRFCRELIKFRLNQPTVRQTKFLSGGPHEQGLLPDVSWFDQHGVSIDWQGNFLPLTSLLTAPTLESSGDDIILMCNPTGNPIDFRVPRIASHKRWQLFVDSAADSPRDLFTNRDGPRINVSAAIQLVSHSLKVLIAGHV